MTGLLLLALAATAWLLWTQLYDGSSAARARQRRQSTRPPRTDQRTRDDAGPAIPQSYTALSVRPGPVACEAARNLAALRFLKTAAPALPLRGCDATTCQCAFREHADRRSGSVSERRMGIGLQSERYGTSGEPERRQRRGRRAGDHW